MIIFQICQPGYQLLSQSAIKPVRSYQASENKRSMAVLEHWQATLGRNSGILISRLILKRDKRMRDSERLAELATNLAAPLAVTLPAVACWSATFFLGRLRDTAEKSNETRCWLSPRISTNPEHDAIPPSFCRPLPQIRVGSWQPGKFLVWQSHPLQTYHPSLCHRKSDSWRESH